MNDSIFAYCERGVDAAAFAEPLNALSNVSFFIAAAASAWLVSQRPRAERSLDHWLLVGLLVAIGFGSLTFHLFATRATATLDVAPIAVFTLVYLGFALNRLLNMPPGFTVLAVSGFGGLMVAAANIRCGGFGVTSSDAEGARECLNGSIAYLPTFGAMALVGILLFRRGHIASRPILWASGIFAVSLVFRTIDRELCDSLQMFGRPIGTHFVWHTLNGLVLFLLMLASTNAGPRYGTRRLPDVHTFDVAETMAQNDWSERMKPARVTEPPLPPTLLPEPTLVRPDNPHAVARRPRRQHKKLTERIADVVEPVDTQDLKS